MNDYSLLFARHETSSQRCCCHLTGAFCPRHGTYEPPTRDAEIAESIAQDSRRPGSGLRIIRKRLDD